jgi:hypothetical protein
LRHLAFLDHAIRYFFFHENTFETTRIGAFQETDCGFSRLGSCL